MPRSGYDISSWDGRDPPASAPVTRPASDKPGNTAPVASGKSGGGGGGGDGGARGKSVLSEWLRRGRGGELRA
ncbi:predicted protein [Chaetomium globosum CBS 148.51]|uniref:Uncharacterized protein n=1 Tax=Chaetomium globosum (strain ATCC 6205 / CBS 148.51 / DSM 1962 / NBRC 6347 / NRRL 1970) TaxID=306901 RepID=Q2GQP8_CHAGB|nr:uncharacterized protein CHGG_09706 [Chaetomium globosum CBS 148.51]EAQ83302.1 predicted protein [Chaetomium globosum CBS 148.51]